MGCTFSSPSNEPAELAVEAMGVKERFSLASKLIFYAYVATQNMSPCWRLVLAASSDTSVTVVNAANHSPQIKHDRKLNIIYNLQGKQVNLCKEPKGSGTFFM